MSCSSFLVVPVSKEENSLKYNEAIIICQRNVVLTDYNWHFQSRHVIWPKQINILATFSGSKNTFRQLLIREDVSKQKYAFLH